MQRAAGVGASAVAVGVGATGEELDGAGALVYPMAPWGLAQRSEVAATDPRGGMRGGEGGAGTAVSKGALETMEVVRMAEATSVMASRSEGGEGMGARGVVAGEEPDMAAMAVALVGVAAADRSVAVMEGGGVMAPSLGTSRAMDTGILASDGKRARRQRCTRSGWAVYLGLGTANMG